MELFGIIFAIGLLLGIFRLIVIGVDILQRHISRERVILRNLLIIVIAMLSFALPFILYIVSEVYKESPLLSYWVPMIGGGALALLGFVVIIRDYVLFFRRKRHKTA
jgi:hypothetical protein